MSVLEVALVAGATLAFVALLVWAHWPDRKGAIGGYSEPVTPPVVPAPRHRRRHVGDGGSGSS